MSDDHDHDRDDDRDRDGGGGGGGNVTRLPVRHRPDPDDDPPLRVVRRSACRHDRVEIDAACAEVVCGDCGERLDPVAVLVRMSRDDDRLRWRREALREEVRGLTDRVRFTCGSCGQVNDLRKPLRTRTS